MTKSKKHSPIQTETEPSIISQIPREHMKTAIEELVAMARSNRMKRAAESSQETEMEALAKEVDSHPGPAILSDKTKNS